MLISTPLKCPIVEPWYKYHKCANFYETIIYKRKKKHIAFVSYIYWIVLERFHYTKRENVNSFKNLYNYIHLTVSPSSTVLSFRCKLPYGVPE